MEYTVHELAKLSNVSVRTLHWYDEIDLLKPAYQKSNGYRYYKEEQLLELQQILFFKDLGFDLQKIKKIIKSNDFDKQKALKAHKQILTSNILRCQNLVETIEKTLKKLGRKKNIADQELFIGFDEHLQNDYFEYLENTLNVTGKVKLKESLQKTKKWTPSDFAKKKKEFDVLCLKLSKLFKKGLKPQSQEVQSIFHEHYKWLSNFWTADSSTYISLGKGYTGIEWKKVFEKFDNEHPKFAKFIEASMKEFAKKNLK